MKIPYIYYHNSQKDAEGRELAGIYGHRSGDELTLAYAGTIEVAGPQTAREYICDALYEKFNISRPDNYRGPSMSIGDVIVLNHKYAYSVANSGFDPIVLASTSESEFEIKMTPANWLR